MRPRYLILAVFVALLVCAIAQPGMAQGVDVSPIVLVPFDLHGTYQSQAGVSLSLHVIPESDTNKTQDWMAKHVTLEIPCVGVSWDTLKAGLGVAANVTAKEGIGLKAGVAYLQEIKKPSLMFGISIPL